MESCAAIIAAPLYRAGHEWRVEPGEAGFRYVGRSTLDLELPALPGRHQIDNAGLAIATVEEFGAFGIAPADIAEGLRRGERAGGRPRPAWRPPPPPAPPPRPAPLPRPAPES